MPATDHTPNADAGRPQQPDPEIPPRRIPTDVEEPAWETTCDEIARALRGLDLETAEILCRDFLEQVPVGRHRDEAEEWLQVVLPQWHEVRHLNRMLEQTRRQLYDGDLDGARQVLGEAVARADDTQEIKCPDCRGRWRDVTDALRNQEQLLRDRSRQRKALRITLAIGTVAVFLLVWYILNNR